MLFLATTTHNTIRASFNIALVAMVSDNMTAEENVTIVDPCPGASWTINKTHEYVIGHVTLAVIAGDTIMVPSYRGYPAKRALSAMCKHGG